MTMRRVLGEYDDDNYGDDGVNDGDDDGDDGDDEDCDDGERTDLCE